MLSEYNVSVTSIQWESSVLIIQNHTFPTDLVREKTIKPGVGDYITNLLINLSEPFFDTTVGPRPNLARMCG